jgi:hypothetical protein
MPLHRKFPNRASEFEKKLSEARIGGMPETRDYMFDAVEIVLSGRSDNPPSLPELFSEAGKLARETAAKGGHESEKNWAVAEKCVRRLMLLSGVLLNDKREAIRDTIGCNSSPVKHLVADARRIIEGSLAEHIIGAMNGVNYDDDLYYLGLTLYRRVGQKPVSPEDLKVKADALLLYLLVEKKTIEIADDKTIRLCTNHQAAPAAK